MVVNVKIFVKPEDKENFSFFVPDHWGVSEEPECPEKFHVRRNMLRDLRPNLFLRDFLVTKSMPWRSRDVEPRHLRKLLYLLCERSLRVLAAIGNAVLLGQVAKREGRIFLSRSFFLSRRVLDVLAALRSFGRPKLQAVIRVLKYSVIAGCEMTPGCDSTQGGS